MVPAICKHGVSAIDEILNDPDSLIVAIAGLQQKGRKTKLTRKIAELEPKAGCDDFALSCCNVLPVTVTAKDYGWPGKKMNLFLADRESKMGQTWLLYADYADKGYTKSNTSTGDQKDAWMYGAVRTLRRRREGVGKQGTENRGS